MVSFSTLLLLGQGIVSAYPAYPVLPPRARIEDDVPFRADYIARNIFFNTDSLANAAHIMNVCSTAFNSPAVNTAPQAFFEECVNACSIVKGYNCVAYENQEGGWTFTRGYLPEELGEFNRKSNESPVADFAFTGSDFFSENYLDVSVPTSSDESGELDSSESLSEKIPVTLTGADLTEENFPATAQVSSFEERSSSLEDGLDVVEKSNQYFGPILNSPEASKDRYSIIEKVAK